MRPRDRLDWLAALAADSALMKARPRAARVGAALMRYCNEETGEAWAALETIAAKLGMHRQRVSETVSAMVVAGWLEAPHGRSRGRGSTVYRPRFAQPVWPLETVRQDGRITVRQNGQSTDRRSGRMKRSTVRRSTSNRPAEPLQPSAPPDRNLGNLMNLATSDESLVMSEVVKATKVVGPSFTLKDGSAWHAPAGLIDRLSTTYPNIDIDAELAKAALWCDANPAKRKTARGMPKFLAGWVGRAGDAVRPRPSDSGLLSPDDCGAISEDKAREILGMPPIGAAP